ncbi:MAG: hypothetical protein QNJ30_04515 [Kiloniellales bacterium]|nr:hypothetical protein [Kiloniellales bacterium]
MYGTAIGWWDYDASDRPTLINRESAERVRMGEEVCVRGKRPGQRWIRLDYLHDDLEFPVLACWMPEQGYIVVDYLASAALWRKESNSNKLHPPYGTWVRVDDCILDAIWCWPGILEEFSEDSSGSPRRRRPQKKGVVGLLGGWCNGTWRPEFLRVCTAGLGLPHWLRKLEATGRKSILPLSNLMPTDAAPPSPWVFLDPVSIRKSKDLDLSRWRDMRILSEAEELLLKRKWSAPNPDDLADEYFDPVVRDMQRFRLPLDSRCIAIDGAIPQLRSLDDSRILFPFRAEFSFAREPWVGDLPIGARVRFVLLESNMTGLCGVWFMEAAKSFPEAATSDRRVLYQCKGGSTDREKILVEEVSIARQYPSILFDYQASAPWEFSVHARRKWNRILQDAFLFWEGTEMRPDCWEIVPPEVLSYRSLDTLVTEAELLGGMRVVGYKILARLEEPRP